MHKRVPTRHLFCRYSIRSIPVPLPLCEELHSPAALTPLQKVHLVKGRSFPSKAVPHRFRIRKRKSYPTRWMHAPSLRGSCRMSFPSEEVSPLPLHHASPMAPSSLFVFCKADHLCVVLTALLVLQPLEVLLFSLSFFFFSRWLLPRLISLPLSHSVDISPLPGHSI